MDTVNTSEIIAHAVLGLHVKSLAPATLLAGDKFAEAGVYGVVESDFFDWVVEGRWRGGVHSDAGETLDAICLGRC
jgi:hypothetical protein